MFLCDLKQQVASGRYSCHANAITTVPSLSFVLFHMHVIKHFVSDVEPTSPLGYLQFPLFIMMITRLLFVSQ